MSHEPKRPRAPRPERRTVVELHADGRGDDALEFTARVFHAFLRASEERGWQVEVRTLEEVDEVAGVRRATLAIDGSAADVAAG